MSHGFVQPPSKIPFVGQNGRNATAWTDWLHRIYDFMHPTIKVSAYAKASLTTANGLAADQNASDDFSSLIYVPDATGGASLAYSNGTDWISLKTKVSV